MSGYIFLNSPNALFLSSKDLLLFSIVFLNFCTSTISFPTCALTLIVVASTSLLLLFHSTNLDIKYPTPATSAPTPVLIKANLNLVNAVTVVLVATALRSEERRVGKEWRYWRSW